MRSTLTVTSARPDELVTAFRLVFGRLAVAERERRVHTALELVRAGELDPAGVLVAWQDALPVGCFVCQATPGASALVWTPGVAGRADERAVADELVRHACAWLCARGTKLAHALLSEEEMARAAPLLRHGFAHVTRLRYLRHRLDELPSFTPRLRYETYAACDPVAFHDTLVRSYEGTLDCPEVNDVRTADEIIAGHRAQGLHDPTHWWLARDKDEPAGVLLLADVPALGGWDLSYLGVVPSARRRGVGRELTCKALAEARRAGAPQVSLAVDERNVPAWELYRGLGFVPYDRREVLLALFVARP